MRLARKSYGSPMVPSIRWRNTFPFVLVFICSSFWFFCALMSSSLVNRLGVSVILWFIALVIFRNLSSECLVSWSKLMVWITSVGDRFIFSAMLCSEVFWTSIWLEMVRDMFAISSCGDSGGAFCSCEDVSWFIWYSSFFGMITGL